MTIPLRRDLSDFAQLMLLRCWRIDRVYRAISDYVTKTMGEKYVMPPVISFEVETFCITIRKYTHLYCIDEPFTQSIDQSINQ